MCVCVCVCVCLEASFLGITLWVYMYYCNFFVPVLVCEHKIGLAGAVI